MMKFDTAEVYQEIATGLKVTPLIQSESLGSLCQCDLHLKMENEQITGSFKLRGVLSKFFWLRRQGVDMDKVVAASTGNHALAVCHASRVCGADPVIFVPESISISKLEKLEAQGVEIRREGSQSGETEQIASAWARKHNIPLIHPYNDSEVIAGQGTIAVELLRQLDHIDQVFVPVGGGGLISGIASYLKHSRPHIKIVGVQPLNACEMAESIRLGRIVDTSSLPTVSDGTAGGLDPETITFQCCRQLVDEFVLIEENEIISALVLLEKHLSLKVEPAASLALAGILKSKDTLCGQVCVAVVCGGNIDEHRFNKLVQMSQ